MSRPLFVAATALLCCQSAIAQVPTSPSGRNIPIRPLGPVIAASKDTLGPRIVTRGLSDGSVLVGVFAYGTPPDLGRRRVKIFDATLQHITPVFDSTSMPQLIRYTGDSTLALDQPSRTIIVLDPKGKTVRTMALPRQQDFPGLTGFIRTPWIDPRGRLVYQGTVQRPPLKPGQSPLLAGIPFLPDSAPIVRGNFETRTIDTIAKIKIAQPGSLDVKQDNPNIIVRATLDPTSTSDEWAMLPDGTIAIVREHDYHVDWIAPDGTRSSTPKMPFDWRRVTDEQKQATLDSLRPSIDSLRVQNPPQTVTTPDGQAKFSIEFQAIVKDKMPDYKAPIGPGSVRADLDGNLWIVPRTSAAARGGLLYDVVNRKGEISERVQFPKGAALVGFGPGGIVYLNTVEGNNGFLSVARIR
jgi:hypothetical protein